MSKVTDIMEAEDIQGLFERAQAAALQVYASKSVGEEEFKAQVTGKLRVDFREHLQRMLRENDLKSKDACKTHIERIWSQLGYDGKGFFLLLFLTLTTAPSQSLSPLFYYCFIVFSSTQEYEGARQELLKRYSEVAKGPSKVLVMNGFLERITSGVVRSLFESMALAKKSAESLGKKVTDLEASSIRERESTLKMEKDLEYLRKEQAASSQDLKKRTDELQQERERLAHSSHDLSDLKQKLAASIAEVATLKQELQKVGANLQASRQREADFEKAIKATTEKSETLDTQLRSTFEKTSKEVTAKDAKITALASEISQLKEQIQRAQQSQAVAERRAEELARISQQEKEAVQLSLGDQLIQARKQHEEQLAHMTSRAEGEKQHLSAQIQRGQEEQAQLLVIKKTKKKNLCFYFIYLNEFLLLLFFLFFFCFRSPPPFSNKYQHW
jgi:myosin heavy subunit